MGHVQHWHYDGKQMHNNLISETGLTRTSKTKEKGMISLWNDGQGGELSQFKDGTLHGKFHSATGPATFELKPEHKDEYSHPEITFHSALSFNYHFEVWRNCQFEGKFSINNEVLTLNGRGYFQKVALNMPMMPWLWNWTIWPNGTIFSYMVPYIGLQVFKRSNKRITGIVNRLIYPIRTKANLYNPSTGANHTFDNVQVIPRWEETHQYPYFYVVATNNNGDHLKLVLEAIHRASFDINNKVFLRLWESRYCYNEFIIRVVSIQGEIDGTVLSKSQLGQGWGNCEYTWGLSY